MRFKFCLTILCYLSLINVILAENINTSQYEHNPPSSNRSEPIQDEVQLISISSNGNDVRTVLYNLFSQTKKNFIFEPKFYQQLYLNLNDVEFEEALALICQVSNYEYKIQNGIYNIHKISPNQIIEAEKTSATHIKDPDSSIKFYGKLPASILTKKVNLRMHSAEIASVFNEIGRQLNIKIEVHNNVPKYKIDAILKARSLKIALNLLTEKAGLKYQFTNEMSILISKRL